MSPEATVRGPVLQRGDGCDRGATAHGVPTQPLCHPPQLHSVSAYTCSFLRHVWSPRLASTKPRLCAGDPGVMGHIKQMKQCPALEELRSGGKQYMRDPLCAGPTVSDLLRLPC